MDHEVVIINKKQLYIMENKELEIEAKIIINKFEEYVDSEIDTIFEKKLPEEIVSMIMKVLIEDYWAKIYNLKNELNAFYNFIWDLEETCSQEKENKESISEKVLEKIILLKKNPHLINDFIIDNIFYDNNDNAFSNYVDFRLKNDKGILEKSYNSRFLSLVNFKERFKKERGKLIDSIFDDALIYSLFRFIYDKSNILSLSGLEVKEILENKSLFEIKNLIEFIKNKQKLISFKDNEINSKTEDFLLEIGTNKSDKKAEKIIGYINEEIHEDNLYQLSKIKKTTIADNRQYTFNNYLTYDEIMIKFLF